MPQAVARKDCFGRCIMRLHAVHLVDRFFAVDLQRVVAEDLIAHGFFPCGRLQRQLDGKPGSACIRFCFDDFVLRKLGARLPARVSKRNPSGRRLAVFPGCQRFIQRLASPVLGWNELGVRAR